MRRSKAERCNEQKVAVRLAKLSPALDIRSGDHSFAAHWFARFLWDFIFLGYSLIEHFY
jgi:hypothetical protein